VYSLQCTTYGNSPATKETLPILDYYEYVAWWLSG